MKKFYLLFTLTTFLCTALFSRENPFETTQGYEAELAQLMELEEDYPYEFKDKSLNKKPAPKKEVMKKPAPKKTEKMPMKKVAKKTPKPIEKRVPLNHENTMVKKKEVMKPAKPKMEEKVSMPEQKMVEIQEPEMPNTPEMMQEAEMPQIAQQKVIDLDTALQHLKENKTEVLVPQRKDVDPKMPTSTQKVTTVKEVPKVVEAPKLDKTVKILPFVTIHYTEDKIEISSKYDVFRKFTMPDRNKVVLDYHGKVYFGTKYHKFDTQYYKDVLLGNHVKERYFRIAIKLQHKPNKYKVTYKDKLVTILFDKDLI